MPSLMSSSGGVPPTIEPPSAGTDKVASMMAAMALNIPHKSKQF